ncbi:MAG: hypothetical protein IPL28_18165 [Chloroflexi bacterium]|nr:hypothetical protein [Chloroflexota bacterium]
MALPLAGWCHLGDNNSTINTAGVSFIGNAAYGDGGAIYSNGSVNILATNFSANQALGKHPANGQANPNTGHGGAIYISGSGSLNIALSNLRANTASKSGVGCMGQSTTATISDNNFAANVAGGGGDNRAGGGAFLQLRWNCLAYPLHLQCQSPYAGMAGPFSTSSAPAVLPLKIARLTPMWCKRTTTMAGLGVPSTPKRT